MNNLEIKSEQFNVRCTKEEKQILIEKANELGISLSEYILNTCLTSQLELASIHLNIPIIVICNIQTLFNQFVSHSISQKKYKKKMKKEIKKLWLH